MNKYDAFLIKYAEIGIKGKNRHVFEEAARSGSLCAPVRDGSR